MVVLEKIAAVSQSLLVLRCNGSALARNACRDALRELAECLLVNQQVPLGLLQHVDESGRDYQTPSIHDTPGGRICRGMAYERDAVSGDADIRINPRVACSVHDSTVADKKVVFLSQRAHRREQQE